MATKDSNQLLEDVRRTREVVVGPGGLIEHPKDKDAESGVQGPRPESRPVKPATFGAR